MADSTNRKTTRQIQFAGINGDADTLGVNRTHLWRVLTGRRDSKPLIKRYRQLKRQQCAARKIA